MQKTCITPVREMLNSLRSQRTSRYSGFLLHRGYLLAGYTVLPISENTQTIAPTTAPTL